MRLLACSLALTLALGCEGAPPKLRSARAATSTQSQAAPATSTSAAPTSTAVKLDTPPRPVDPAKRPRQVRIGKQLVIDSPGKWSKDCLIHRACHVTAEPLAACAPGENAESWSALAGPAEHFTNPQVSIKGQLVLEDGFFSTAVSCGKGECCNGTRTSMALAGPPYDLELVGLGCGGDESRRCCSLRADGTVVIAKGRLSYDSGRLLLHSPELCRVVD